MASLDALQALTDHPEWIPPRSDARVFLGEPGAPEATKTTVEPGNAFSPGMRTFGVTWWLRFPAANVFFAPELAPLEDLHWRFEDGYLPLLHCETQVRDISIRHSLFQDGSAADQSEAVCARLRLVNDGRQSVEAQLFLALRSLGPAGGPLRDLRVDATGRGFRLARRDLLLLGVDRAPDAIGCGIGDPSPAARAGSAPIAQRVEDPAGWCFGLMRFDLALRPGEIWQLHLDCPQQTYGTIEDDLPGTARVAAERYDERSLAHLATWRNRLTTISLETPDAAFREAFFAGLLHMLIATVGDQARIAPLAYPLPWLRDSIYIIRALDLAGLHAIARGAVAHCARNDFFGGFGAEGDAPGQGIWAIVQHYRLTGDRVWLRSVYPDLRRKCDWLFRMRRAERPIQVFVDTPVFAFTQAERASGVICLAARAGIIRGTMDHGVAYSVGWINQWALRGLGDAAFAARELGHAADAEAYEGEYKALYVALRAFAERTPEYFSYERTVNSLLWPTRAWEQDPQWVDPRFDAWWGEHRGDGAAYTPEPYWLYFEFAQAHNALLLGRRDRAWQTIDYRLRHQDAPGLYGWREGAADLDHQNAGLASGVTLLGLLRGCQSMNSIMPHGWSQAEMWLLQRATLVDEWRDGLLLFAGVPRHWLAPAARVAFERFPTAHGTVSASIEVGERAERALVTVAGADSGTPLFLRLPGHTQDLLAPGDGRPLVVQVDFAP